MTETTVAIEKMCYGGAGLGRLEGKACFVPFTAPGDRARIRLVKEKRSFVEGELVELVEASPLRIGPLCPVFGICGGCNWQYLSYDEQLKQKREIFTETLRRMGRAADCEVLPVLGSPEAYGYRSRIQLKISKRNGSLAVGFFRTGSHQVVDVGPGCPLAAPLLNKICGEFRPFLEAMPEAGDVFGIDLSMGDDGESVAIVHAAPGSSRPLRERLSAGRGELPAVSGLYLRCGGKGEVEKIYGVDSLSYGIPAGLLPGARDMRLRFSRGGFSQVNYSQNLQLIKTVYEWSGLRGNERVLDLFCGNGNISLPIAPYAAEVVGVEGYAPSIADATANADANGVANAAYQVGDASAAIRRFAKRKERFDLVILDPPRGGAEAAGEIALLAPEKIIYVSCDPATLARDLAALGEKGYRAARSQPVDMFPQTYHLESVTELVRI